MYFLQAKVRPLRQGEALAVSADGAGVYATGENQEGTGLPGQPIYYYAMSSSASIGYASVAMALGLAAFVRGM